MPGQAILEGVFEAQIHAWCHAEESRFYRDDEASGDGLPTPPQILRFAQNDI
jgi:hypothetical protein